MKKIITPLLLMAIVISNAQDLTQNYRKLILNSPNDISLFQTNATTGIWASGAITSDKWAVFEDATSSKERLTILPGGNVGIGTSNPLDKFQIGSSFAFHDGGHKVLGFLYSSSGTDLDTSKYAAEIRLDPTYGNLRLGTSSAVDNAPSTRMTIDKLGRVAIGTTYTSNGVLTVNGDATSGIRVENDVPGGEASIRLRSKNTSGTSYHADIASFHNGSTGFVGFKSPHNNTAGSGYRLIVNNLGNVGIGTTNPDSKLAVQDATNNQLSLINTTGNTWQFRSGSTGSLIFKDDNVERIRINSSGNMGIGTSNPGTYRLAVKGKIRAEEIKVETGWADYVFKEDYILPTLEEVEKHITEKGHLINIPSAEEVVANGIQLGEMNKLLLEKIEELTLYTLEQEKKLQLQDDKLQQIKIILNQLIQNKN